MPIEPKTESLRRFNRYYTALEPFFAHPEVRAYTMFILSFLAMSFFGYFAIRPTLITISTLRRQIADARFVDQKLQEKINNLSAVSVEYEAIKPDLELIWTAVPKESQFPLFVKSLERIASESGATIGSFVFKPINLNHLESTTSAREIPIDFRLTLQGDYSKLADFIGKLSRLERLSIIEKMEISTKGEKDTLRLNLEGKTFYVQ